MLGEQGDDRRGITRTGSDFEDSVGLCQRERLGHHSDHIGLRNALTARKRYGFVVIGEPPQSVWNKLVTRHLPHSDQHVLVSDAPGA